jgi:hypothetical protein
MRKLRIPPCLAEAFITHHRNVFALILFLSEGRVGIALEHYNN